jgi:hypothetical protein
VIRFAGNQAAPVAQRIEHWPPELDSFMRHDMSHQVNIGTSISIAPPATTEAICPAVLAPAACISR